MKTTRLLLVGVFFITTLLSNSQSLTGKVIGIMDGDTFKLFTADSTLVNVRLANIDCPEKKQPFSSRAKEFTSDAIFGKTVTVNVQSKDRYRRLISNVIYINSLSDSLSLCHELVRNGLAWHYVKFSKDKTLQHMEDEARASKIGLWQDPNPIAPWEWRDFKKKKKVQVE